jgi:SAM-dependent methyltransferase
MDRAYAERYKQLYARHWWWRVREDIVFSRLQDLAPPGGFGHILDVGCGDGLFFERLTALGDPEGVEADAEVVTEAGSRHGRIHVVPFDHRFEPGTRYGLILLLDVLEHLADDGACLRHALSLLAPGGKIVVTVPAFPALWTVHDEVNHHLRRYTRRGLKVLAERAGVRVEWTECFFPLVGLMKLVVRAKEAVLAPSRELPSVPRPSINGLLYRYAGFEYAALRRFHLPFGGSLLLVGGSDVPA